MVSLTLILTLGSLAGYGAKVVPDTVSLNLQEVKLERFVEVMKQKTGLNFLYNSLLFKDAKTVTVEAKGENWEAVLKRVLEKEVSSFSEIMEALAALRREADRNNIHLQIEDFDNLDNE